jgi:hypothetical protein
VFWIVFTTDDRLEHGSTTLPEYVREHTGELDVGIFERLLDAERVLRDFPDQLLTGPGEIAQLLDASWRHEAAANQAVREQVGDPGGIVHVRLTTGTLRMCWALASTSSKRSSSKCQTGFQ